MDQMLLEKVLRMPPNERFTFAELILASIDNESEEIRQVWIQEIYARMQTVREGKANLLNFESLYHAD
ncbi:addiction module protein [candidate division KSB1 bacterium]|nr:addiction module protein [candidate division KSB1 bacterium]